MAISNYAEIILSEAQKKKFNLKYIKENAQNVLKENSFLKFLLNDFLDINQIKNKCFKLCIKAFNCKEIISEVIQTVTLKSKMKNIAIIFEFIVIDFIIHNDPLRLQ